MWCMRFKNNYPGSVRDSFNRDPRHFLFNRSPTSFVYRAIQSLDSLDAGRSIFRGRGLVVTYLHSTIHSPHPSIHSHSIHHYFGPRPAHGAQKFLEGSTVFPRFSFFLSSLWKKRVVFLSLFDPHILARSLLNEPFLQILPWTLQVYLERQQPWLLSYLHFRKSISYLAD